MTQQDLMTSSHGPEQVVEASAASRELGSDIELFNGQNLFKKKKRLDRNSKVSIDSVRPQALRLSGVRKQPFPQRQPEDESLELESAVASSRQRPEQPHIE